MRLSVIPLVLAGLAIQHAGATPIRVVVVTSKQDISPHHAIGSIEPDFNVATLIRPTQFSQYDQSRTGRVRHACGSLANKAAQKSAEFAQMLRGAFGISIPHEHAFNEAANVEAKILPFIGTPIDVDRPRASYVNFKNMPDVAPIEHSTRPGAAVGWTTPHSYGGATPIQVWQAERPGFMARVNTALVSLGTWEGRVVAFVLGCGIGVLLRMFFVLGLVIVRSIKGHREESEDDETTYYEGVILFDESELAPPQYTAPPPDVTIDEKKPLPESDNTSI
ncbi:hypothetical protein BXZ70DRAFT_321 [Cristinia sonorae]|uniref:Uncharacterized protein n=1 Tax=Cristinia sonorae TaxID=1940300 RepID=A0A8K0UYY2_9AGAR|nr:hypothetical protein BXZ70DRAFT_321 [Cristinia sonorae]